MKFSAKTKYGLNAMIALANYYEGETLVPLAKLSDELQISKIYLEQIFALLKQHQLVTSIKGPKGGYKLSESPQNISVLSIIQATESSLFEKESGIVDEKNNIEKVVNELVFEPFDKQMEKTLSMITLKQLLDKFQDYNFNDSYMYYL